MVDKIWIKPQEFYDQCFKLAGQVFKSPFNPTFITGIMRGGVPVANVIHEFYNYRGFIVDYGVVIAKSYDGTEQGEELRLRGIDFVLDLMSESMNDRRLDKHYMLLVDEVWDSGSTMVAMKRAIEDGYHKKFGQKLELKTAVLDFKPIPKKTYPVPDFYLQTRDTWVDYPAELKGHSLEEIEEHKGKEIADLLR